MRKLKVWGGTIVAGRGQLRVLVAATSMKRAAKVAVEHGYPSLTTGHICKERRFPHILRASAVTHMLDSGLEPGNVQERVGHASSKTTFGYMKATKAAAQRIDKIFGDDDK